MRKRKHSLLASPARRLRPRRFETRRTTLTLPAPLLRRADEMARERGQTVSAVVTGLLQHGLREVDRSRQRAAQTFTLWKKAYGPLTEEEMMLLDGIILEEPETAPS